MNYIESFASQQTDNGPQLPQQKKWNHQVIQGVGFQFIQNPAAVHGQFLPALQEIRETNNAQAGHVFLPLAARRSWGQNRDINQRKQPDGGSVQKQTPVPYHFPSAEKWKSAQEPAGDGWNYLS
jgi:hypothetical protein